MIKIVPVRAIYPICPIFSMSPTPQNSKFSQDCTVILVLHKEEKSDWQILKTVGYHLKSVQKMLRVLKGNGGNTLISMGWGRPRSKVTVENVWRAREMRRRNPICNIYQVSDACNCSLTSGRCLDKASGLKSLSTLIRPLLPKSAKVKRVVRCQKLEEWFIVNEGRRGANHSASVMVFRLVVSNSKVMPPFLWTEA